MASQIEQIRFRYWTTFRNYLADSASVLSIETPNEKNWIKIGPPGMFRRGGAHLAGSALVRPLEIRANFVLEDPDSLPVFEALEEQRGVLEDETGESLVFARGENNKQVGRIYIARSVDFRDQADWPNQFKWLHASLRNLRSTFQPRVG